ncbi:hypothetical protein D9B38_04170 [Corynebacterium diphtheriae]|uniref:hypothetical protein n=1 Tax=Corynebacterium diphtheriae TaxID=1717 RepID=UPI00095B3180|nr:hypothetical protein [Corynebacterium diphtheriae]OLN17209.1 hypothetical protein BUE68_08925 [Corynebacterium diphtheriae]RKW92162.1 hypothetical protein D9B38_04170 [Corynebacterium diphtheriae]CAB0498917.1 hypothetical protein CIP107507_00665 [Corynebacterium diphtheriae]CAB0501848.1 hypothetical protein CIP101352_00814 [Corynebacterium diphtheriae]
MHPQQNPINRPHSSEGAWGEPYVAPPYGQASDRIGPHGYISGTQSDPNFYPSPQPQAGYHIQAPPRFEFAPIPPAKSRKGWKVFFYGCLTLAAFLFFVSRSAVVGANATEVGVFDSVVKASGEGVATGDVPVNLTESESV